MGTLLFRITSLDAVVSLRWKAAFVREQWETEICHPQCAAQSGNRAAISLIDEACLGDSLEKVLADIRRNICLVAVFVFGDRKKTPNSRVAALLNSGADDFIYSDTDERIVVAKLKAHIRRSGAAITEAGNKCRSLRGAISVDSARRLVLLTLNRGRQTQLDTLTLRELEILKLLIENEARVVSREAILETIWGDDSANVYAECVDKHIESMRRKLGIPGKWIKTVYGAGYMFTDNSAAARGKQK